LFRESTHHTVDYAPNGELIIRRRLGIIRLVAPNADCLALSQHENELAFGGCPRLPRAPDIRDFVLYDVLDLQSRILQGQPSENTFGRVGSDALTENSFADDQYAVPPLRRYFKALRAKAAVIASNWSCFSVGSGE